LVEQYDDLGNADKAQHHANITNMDRAVGRLLATLDELKLAENTVVVFTSDNGPETLNRYKTAHRSYGSPGDLRAMKLWLYEGGIRVPGILRWPQSGVKGKTISDPICNLDLLPTFCELAGVKPPQDRALDGTSFAALFADKPFERATPLYWHYVFALGEPKAAMRVGDWMILGKWQKAEPKNVARGKSEKLTGFELYNLKDDGRQQRDLAEKLPEKTRELAALLVKKYDEVQAAAPVWKE
jgi:arylsulfatase A